MKNIKVISMNLMEETNRIIIHFQIFLIFVIFLLQFIKMEEI